MDILSKQRLTNLLIIILIVMNITSLSFIWYKQLQGPPPPPPQNPGREHVNNFLEKELSLTQDQRNQFSETRKEHAEKTRKINDRIDELKKIIMQESFSDKPDINKVNELTAKIADQQKEYEKFLFEHFQKLMSICDSDQKIKLKNIFMSSLKPVNRPPGLPGQQPPPNGPPPQGKRPR